MAKESLELFRLIVFNCAIRNGDAHLKNFGVVYDEVQGAAHLAPAYDLVTTTAYLPKDRLALTLNGSTEWPTARELSQFAEAMALASPRQIKSIFGQISDALSDTSSQIRTAIKVSRDFQEIGERLLSEWEAGVRQLRA